MIQPGAEKRAMRRFPVRLPVSFRLETGGTDVRTRTLNISARGICFYCGTSLPEGSQLYFTLTLPPEITQTESISMRCLGRVVRAEVRTTERHALIAAVIDRYEILGG